MFFRPHVLPLLRRANLFIRATICSSFVPARFLTTPWGRHYHRRNTKQRAAAAYGNTAAYGVAAACGVAAAHRTLQLVGPVQPMGSREPIPHEVSRSGRKL